MSLRSKVSAFNALIRENLGELSVWEKAAIYLDFAFERIVFKSTKTDYFQYGFYYRSHAGRKKFVNFGRFRKFRKVCNDPRDAKIFSDKALFVEKFKNYLGREILDMRCVSRDEFICFMREKGKGFVKPIDGSWGIGTEIITAAEAETEYEKLKGKPILVEEVIRSHPEMARFNATSLNTLRVVTFVQAGGTVCILPGAAIRIGRKGKVADNFHNFGIGALVDVETGCTITQGVDKTGARYVDHPDSGVRIVGFQVPEWEKICRTVKEAALMVPTVRYVGWDVAITDSGEIVFIEGNDRANPDIGQMCDGVGKWKSYEKCMNEVLKKK